MFEQLQSLVNKLQKAYNTTAKVSRENRKVLQSIKVEAQELRVKIVENLKTTPKVKKEKAVKVEVVSETLGKEVEEDLLPEVEEPKVVEDDDFFNKQ